MQSLNLLLTKLFLIFAGMFLIIFGGFSLVIIGIIMIAGQDIVIWSILSLVCGGIPIFLGMRLVNQFAKITKIDHQKQTLQNFDYNQKRNIGQKLTKLEQNNFLNYESAQSNFFGKSKTEKQEEHLHGVFYELLEKKNGYLTVLNLAMEAKVSGKIANQFLTQKAKEFNHQIVVDSDGGMAYKFEYLTQNEIENLTKD